MYGHGRPCYNATVVKFKVLFHIMIPHKISNTSQNREGVLSHLLSLPPSDLYLRFGNIPSKNSLKKYLEDSFKSTDDIQHQWFAVFDPVTDAIVGALHVSVDKNRVGELAISVSPDFRNRGIGSDLFFRGKTWLEANGAVRIDIQCLSSNSTILRMAKRHNMKIVYDHGEAFGTLSTKKSTINVFIECLANYAALSDRALSLSLNIVKNIP